jgi:hypothetical protein
MVIHYPLSGFAFDTKGLSAPCRGNYMHEEPGNELALDLQGRRHVERFDNADGVYWLQQDTRSSLVMFPLPGAASANEFRKFLEERLPQHLIMDEYQCVMPIEDISDDQLPRLQAWIWVKKHDDSANTRIHAGAIERMVKECGSVAQHSSGSLPQTYHDGMSTEQISLVARYGQSIIELLQCKCGPCHSP